jgi:hypothetical protein
VVGDQIFCAPQILDQLVTSSWCTEEKVSKVVEEAWNKTLIVSCPPHLFQKFTEHPLLLLCGF